MYRIITHLYNHWSGIISKRSISNEISDHKVNVYGYSWAVTAFTLLANQWSILTKISTQVANYHPVKIQRSSVNLNRNINFKASFVRLHVNETEENTLISLSLSLTRLLLWRCSIELSWTRLKRIRWSFSLSLFLSLALLLWRCSIELSWTRLKRIHWSFSHSLFYCEGAP